MDLASCLPVRPLGDGLVARGWWYAIQRNYLPAEPLSEAPRIGVASALGIRSMAGMVSKTHNSANQGADHDLGESLPRSHRLRRRVQIKHIQDQGRRFVAGPLVMMVLLNSLGYRRLGVTVSSRVGNAVVRSRLKRQLRDIFRRHRSLLPVSCDVVIIARNAAAQKEHQALLRSYTAAANQARNWTRW